MHLQNPTANANNAEYKPRGHLCQQIVPSGDLSEACSQWRSAGKVDPFARPAPPPRLPSSQWRPLETTPTDRTQHENPKNRHLRLLYVPILRTSFQLLHIIHSRSYFSRCLHWSPTFPSPFPERLHINHENTSQTNNNHGWRTYQRLPLGSILCQLGHLRPQAPAPGPACREADTRAVRLRQRAA